jgi:hypothetical protein
MRNILNKYNALLFSLFLIFLLSGCKKKEAKKGSTKEFEIEKEYKRGPAVFSIKINKKEITIADRIKLKLEVRVKEDYEVKLPEFGEKLEQFGIVDYSAPPARLVDGGLISLVKTYELEPFLSGDYKIPPMTVQFWKKDEEKKHTIESEELTVHVKSILPEKAADLSLKEIRPPVQMPYVIEWWVYVLGGVLILGSIGLFVFLSWRKRRAKTEAMIKISAHEIAYEQLESLLNEKLIEEGKVKLFYLKLSNILRHYIENRFGLRAPEQTTEEFLASIRFNDALTANHKGMLKGFLQHCDLVKFAEHSPTNEDIQNTFDSCKEFIVETEVVNENKTVLSG